MTGNIAKWLQLGQKILASTKHESTQHPFLLERNEFQFEAGLLLAFILKKPRSFLYAWPKTQLTDLQSKHYLQCLTRRARGEPIAYITQTKEFWSLSLDVTQAALIPRPETELLVETTLQLFRAEEERHILDLGTGSGAIAIAIAEARPHWQLYAIDKFEKTLSLARKNAKKQNIKNIRFQVSDWYCTLPKIYFDAIVSNPPYLSQAEWQLYKNHLAYEPYQALVSGKSGFEAISAIVFSAPSYLKAHGHLLLEHGYQQADRTQALFVKAGFKNIQTLRDLSSKERITMGSAIFV